MENSPEEVLQVTGRKIRGGGLRSRPWVDCGLPNSRKKDVGLPEQQRGTQSEYLRVGISCPGTK